MPSRHLSPFIPYDPATSVQAAELLALSIRDYLRDIRQLTYTDLDALLQYFQQPTVFRIQGSLQLTFSSEYVRAQDGVTVSETETIEFGANGYNVRIHQQEDFYGEGDLINEDRLAVHMSYAELLDTSSASFNRLMEIMETNRGHLRVAPHRFAVLKRRPTSSPK